MANAGTADRDLATKRVIEGLKQIYRQVSSTVLCHILCSIALAKNEHTTR
jgi:hypothetical protein